MPMQTVITVSLTFAGLIFGTFAVNPERSGEVKLATAPEFRTSKPIDSTLVPRAKTSLFPIFGVKDKASPIAPTLSSRPQVQTNKMEEPIGVEAKGTSELEVKPVDDKACFKELEEVKQENQELRAENERLQSAMAAQATGRHSVTTKMWLYGHTGTYTGEVNKAEKPDGKGTFIYADGSKYEGEFQNGELVRTLSKTPSL